MSWVVPSVPARKVSSRTSIVYLIRPSKALPDVDLSRTVVSQCLSEASFQATVRWMRAHYGVLVKLYRIGVVCFIALLFIDHGPMFTLLLTLIPPTSVSVVVAPSFYCLDVVTLIVRSYDFWFMTVFSFLQWSVLGCVFSDARILMCVTGFIGTQQAMFVDANVRNFRSTLATGVLGILLYVLLTSLLAWDQIAGQHPFNLYLYGKKQGDAVDVLAFTTSTLGVFLLKIAWTKRVGDAHPSSPGVVTLPCAVVKTTLSLELLTPSTTHDMDMFRPSNPRKVDLSRQRLLVRALPLIQVDGLDTVLPSKYWQGIAPKYRRWIRIGLLLLAFISWVMTGVQFMLCIWRVLALDMRMKPLETTPGDLIRSTVGAVCALMFCGTFVLFSQRDLLWALVTSFDFLFTSVQVLLLDLCFCDLVGWQPDQAVMGFTYIVWLHWALLLDGLTPNIKRDVLGFSKRYAIPVSASVVLSGLGLLGLVLYVSPGTLHNRVLWELTVASKRIISIRTQTILLGRIFTIVFWCSRQTVLLFLRKEDELQSLYGMLAYQSPYELFPVPRPPQKRKKTRLWRHRRVNIADSSEQTQTPCAVFK